MASFFPHFWYYCCQVSSHSDDQDCSQDVKFCWSAQEMRIPKTYKCTDGKDCTPTGKRCLSVVDKYYPIKCWKFCKQSLVQGFFYYRQRFENRLRCKIRIWIYARIVLKVAGYVAHYQIRVQISIGLILHINYTKMPLDNRHKTLILNEFKIQWNPK